MEIIQHTAKCTCVALAHDSVRGVCEDCARATARVAAHALDRMVPDNLAKPSQSERWRLHFLNGGSGDKLD